MNTIAIIPARYDSTRFPGKPLAKIGGKTMIERVYRQAEKATRVNEIIVATDDERIKQEVERFGGKVVMTGSHHINGTERCAEVMESAYINADIIVNIQGDEPFILPEQIDELVKCFDDENAEIATLVKKADNEELLNYSGEVKVVYDIEKYAMYFSRQTIPFIQKTAKENWLEKQAHYLHVGIYGFRDYILNDIVKLPESKLEKLESLEQIRWLENGYKIKLGFTTHTSMAVETPEDLIAAEAYFQKHRNLFETSF